MTNALTTDRPWTLPNRRLLNVGMKAELTEQGNIAGTGGTAIELAKVQNTLRAIEAKQDARDRTRTLNQLRVGFIGGHASGLWMVANGTGQEEMLITRTAMYDLARCVLPGHGLATIKRLAQTDEVGEKIATASWAQLAHHYGNKEVMVRECNMNINGETRRVIRAVRSTKYATFSHLDLVTALMANGYADKRVLNWTLEDDRMRLRIALDDTPWEGNAILPIAEWGNSETGRGAVKGKGGNIKVICTNGMTANKENFGAFSTPHSGNIERLTPWVMDIAENIDVAAHGTVDMYHRALEVAVDDLHSLVMNRMAGFGEEKAKKAVALLADPTTTVEHVLGAAVDAITLCAQSEGDLILQERMEAEAMNLMSWGLNQGETHGSIRVHN